MTNKLKTAADAYRSMLLEKAFNYKDGGGPNNMPLKEILGIIKKFATQHKLVMTDEPDDDQSYWQKNGEINVEFKHSDADTPSSPTLLIQFSLFNNDVYVNIHGHKDNLVKGNLIDKITDSDIKAAFKAEISSYKPNKGEVTRIKNAAIKIIDKITNVDITANDIKSAIGDVDDGGLTHILIPNTCMIYLLDNITIKDYEFGNSDNEDLFSVGSGLKVVVVAI